MREVLAPTIVEWLQGILRELAQCQSLWLDGNQIGDAGLTSLSDVLASGALTSLKALHVDDGPLGTEHPALEAACEARGIQLP